MRSEGWVCSGPDHRLWTQLDLGPCLCLLPVTVRPWREAEQGSECPSACSLPCLRGTLAPSLYSFGRMRENHIKSQRLSNHNWLKYIPPVCKLPSQEITPYGVCGVTEPGNSNHTGTIPTHIPTPPLFPEHNYSGVYRLTECYSWKRFRQSSSSVVSNHFFFFISKILYLKDPLRKFSV